MARDLDIVLLDYHDDLDRDALLPAGRLREPLAALTRSQAVLVTKVPAHPDAARLEKLGALIHKYSPQAAIGLVRFSVQSLVSVDPSPAPNRNGGSGKAHNDRASHALQEHDLKLLSGRRVLAFCALARPQAFFASLDQLNLTIAGTHAFPDHHWYTENDLRSLQLRAQKLSCHFLVTTEKDIVKLLDFNDLISLPIVAPSLSTNWVGGVPEFLSRLYLAKFKACTSTSGDTASSDAVPHEAVVT